MLCMTLFRILMLIVGHDSKTKCVCVCVSVCACDCVCVCTESNFPPLPPQLQTKSDYTILDSYMNVHGYA